jgi:hypothetical protein
MVGHPMLERLQGVRPMPATKEDRRRAEAEARAAAEAAAPAAAQVKRRPCPSKEHAEHSCRQLLKARRRYRRPLVVSCGGWRVPRLLLALSAALVPGPTCCGSGRCHAGQAGHPPRPSARAVRAAASGGCPPAAVQSQQTSACSTLALERERKVAWVGGDQLCKAILDRAGRQARRAHSCAAASGGRGRGRAGLRGRRGRRRHGQARRAQAQAGRRVSKPARARYMSTLCLGAGPEERRVIRPVQGLPGTKALPGCRARRAPPAGTLAARRRPPSRPAWSGLPGLVAAAWCPPANPSGPAGPWARCDERGCVGMLLTAPGRGQEVQQQERCIV